MLPAAKPHMVVLSGAGISAESGIPTFRGANGLWENHRIEDVASPAAWAKNRELVLRFYNERRKRMWECGPNEGHRGLVELEPQFDISIVTQNVDNLHERAGSTRVLHLHGELTKSRSTLDPGLVYEIDGWELKLGDRCARGSQLRPHIVWFGEAVPMMETAIETVQTADVLVILGTSLNVYPAASLVDFAPAGARIFLIDPAPPAVSDERIHVIRSGAGEGVKQLRQMQNADGFGGHSAQDGNVFRGCRAWFNSDDGYDLIHARGVHQIEHCWAWSNGFVPDTHQRAGNGGGFKMGGWLLNPARFPGHIAVHTITHSLAFNNRAEGFNANYHPGMLRFYNNTAFNNPRQFDLKVAPRLTKPVTHVLRNNIALGDAPPMSGHERNPPDDQFNSWNLENVTVTADDFLSIVPEGVDGPRRPDGSLPDIAFMRPKPGSRLVDAGIRVELPFKGSAPDLGAFETK